MYGGFNGIYPIWAQIILWQIILCLGIWKVNVWVGAYWGMGTCWNKYGTLWSVVTYFSTVHGEVYCCIFTVLSFTCYCVQWQNWHILLSLLPFIALQHSCSPIHVFYISGMTSQLGLLYCCTVHHCWHWTWTWADHSVQVSWSSSHNHHTRSCNWFKPISNAVSFYFIYQLRDQLHILSQLSSLSVCVCVYACVRAKQNKHPGIHWDKHMCSTVIWLIMWYYTDIPIMHCVLS